MQARIDLPQSLIQLRPIMTKAYLTPPRGITLPNGGKMQHGMIIGGIQMQSTTLPRSGSRIRIPSPAPRFSMA
jgi:hypothetical protein